MRYRVGQCVLYRNSGVYKIEAVGRVTFQRGYGEDYYTLCPYYGKGREHVYIPVSAQQFMRRSMTEEQARGCLMELRHMKVENFRYTKPSFLLPHYQALFAEYDINSHLRLFKEICQKEKRLRERDRKLCETDKRFKRDVENLLSEEFAVALNETPEQAKEKLYQALN